MSPNKPKFRKGDTISVEMVLLKDWDGMTDDVLARRCNAEKSRVKPLPGEDVKLVKRAQREIKVGDRVATFRNSPALVVLSVWDKEFAAKFEDKNFYGAETVVRKQADYIHVED